MITIGMFYEWLATTNPTTEAMEARVKLLRHEMVSLRRKAMLERCSALINYQPYTTVVPVAAQMTLPGMGDVLATVWPGDHVDYGAISSYEQTAMAMEKEFDLLRLEIKRREAVAA